MQGVDLDRNPVENWVPNPSQLSTPRLLGLGPASNAWQDVILVPISSQHFLG